MEAFFTFIKGLYTAPFNQFDYYGDRDWILTIILFVMIYGITAVIVIPLIVWGYRKAKWLTQRKQCQHAECNHQWTTNVSESQDSLCRRGEPCCDYCIDRHIDDAIQHEADNEKRVSCPHGCGVMKKDIVDRVIRDVCPAGKHIFLDMEELERINELMHDRGYGSGYSSGRSSGMSTGLVLGVAIG